MNLRRNFVGQFITKRPRLRFGMTINEKNFLLDSSIDCNWIPFYFHCRNSTLDFLNKLNTKYSLGLAANIKNKILVFPGGMEFMRVIYEITRLSMQLLLKRNGHTNNEYVQIIKWAEAGTFNNEIIFPFPDSQHYVWQAKRPEYWPTSVIVSGN